MYTLQAMNLIEYAIILIRKGVKLKENSRELILEYLIIRFTK